MDGPYNRGGTQAAPKADAESVSVRVPYSGQAPTLRAYQAELERVGDELEIGPSPRAQIHALQDAARAGAGLAELHRLLGIDRRGGGKPPKALCDYQELRRAGIPAVDAYDRLRRAYGYQCSYAVHTWLAERRRAARRELERQEALRTMTRNSRHPDVSCTPSLLERTLRALVEDLTPLPDPRPR